MSKPICILELQIEMLLKNAALRMVFFTGCIFYLIPQKKKAADFYMIDIADNNARFPIPIAFFKTYQEAKEFVKDFKVEFK